MNANKLRVCFVAPYPPPYGGITHWTKLVTDYLSKIDNEVDYTIINLSPRKLKILRRSWWNRIVENGVDMLRHRRELRRVITGYSPDVIHIVTSGQFAVIRDISLLRIARKNKVPTIYHLHFGRIPQIAYSNSVEWRLMCHAMRLCSAVVTIDARTHDTIKEYMPGLSVAYVPNPVDIAELPEPHTTCSKTVIFLSMVLKKKGIEELLSAWETVYEKHPDWKLSIVGPYNEDYLHYLKTHYSSNGLNWEGEKKHSEAMLLLNDSEIFILPSHTEGFPNVVLEAMALAKPIIASRVGAIPEMLADNCGVLIDAGDTRSIVSALSGLIAASEKRHQLGENAYKKLTHEYTIDKVMARYVAEWQSVQV